MTQTQVAYWNYRENQRHNRASEDEDVRSHRANEAETNRHNVVTETETQRHNVVTESETGRHNIATETETVRHNVVTEGETARANRENERLKSEQNVETKRSNQANEAIKLQQQEETARHNAAMEQNDINALHETVRHNKKVESLTKSNGFWDRIVQMLNGRPASEVTKVLLQEAAQDPELTQLQKEKLEAEIENIRARTNATRNKTYEPTFSEKPSTGFLQSWWSTLDSILKRTSIPYYVVRRIIMKED